MRLLDESIALTDCEEAPEDGLGADSEGRIVETGETEGTEEVFGEVAEVVETVVVNEDLVSLVGEVDSLMGEIDSLMGEIDSFIGEIDSLFNSLIGEIDSLVSEIDSLIGEIDPFIGDIDSLFNSLIGDIDSFTDSRGPGDIPNIALSSFKSAVFRCAPLTGESSELSDRKSIETTDMRDDLRTRGGDGSESNCAK